MKVLAPLSPTLIAVVFAILSIPVICLANHGPGAGGGGSATISGETLKPGRFEFNLRQDYTKFEHFSRGDAIARAAAGGEFDALNHGFLTTVEAAAGVMENLQVNASLGYFVGGDFVAAERLANGSVEEHTADVTGLTDLVLTAKLRVLRGAPGNLAIIGGVVVPTGRDNVRLSGGETLEPTDQPGTGRWGFPVGLAYSRFLSSRLTIDASVLYTFRLERNDFSIGNRIDAGVALAYRITESVQHFPQFSMFAEINNVYLYRDRQGQSHDDNSGSATIYLTPGGRVRFDQHIALTLAPSFPVYQQVNGEQGKVDFKIAATLSLSF